MITKDEKIVDYYDTIYRDGKKVLIIYYTDGTRKEVVKNPF